ncbi:MAG: hypothetical protein OIF38_03185 [Cellvibrionaceae bacterium]|nr:hypothetical protein [Cellvibrionaceae bacterium]
MRFSKLLAVLGLFSAVGVVQAAEIYMATAPAIVYHNKPFEIHLVVDERGGCSRYEAELGLLPGEIDIRLQPPEGSFCSNKNLINAFTKTVKVELPRLPEGDYDIDVFMGDDIEASGEFDFKIFYKGLMYQERISQESPAAGEVVSGVSVVRGWACQSYNSDALVEFQVDNHDRMRIPYGSIRPDTDGACSRSGTKTGRNIHNGYGGVINWNLFEPGPHRFRLYIDGELKRDFEVIVAPTKSAFMSDVESEFVLDNFPSSGDRSTLRWNTAAQNFIIVDTVLAP